MNKEKTFVLDTHLTVYPAGEKRSEDFANDLMIGGTTDEIMECLIINAASILGAISSEGDSKKQLKITKKLLKKYLKNEK